MTKQTIKQVVRKAVQVAKYAIIAIVVVTSVVGAYVLVNADLRNQTIDTVQGQNEVVAAPKAN